MKNKMRARGFTLIELLVVIAIIGILSGIIMGSLSRARSRGADAKVKAQIASVRSAAEQYFDQIAGYNGLAGDVLSDCTTIDSMFTDANFAVYQYTDAANNYPAGTQLRCSSTDSTFVISATLSSSDKFWCADSSGNSTELTAVDHPTAHPDGALSCI